jgi:transposase
VPLSHAPGEAQADFGEAVVVIAGVEQKAHFMAFDLPHSDDCFVQAFPAETTEAFLEGHVRAFQYFGGVPTRILYDNTTLAVARILGDGERQKTRAFSELQSYYLFARSSDVRARETIRARLRAWSAMCGATSWCRFHRLRVGTN